MKSKTCHGLFVESASLRWKKKKCVSCLSGLLIYGNSLPDIAVLTTGLNPHR
jgi:hypothetical protein